VELQKWFIMIIYIKYVCIIIIIIINVLCYEQICFFLTDDLRKFMGIIMQ